MTLKELESLRQQTEKYLSERRVRDAFQILGNVAEGNMLFEISDRIKQLQQTYRYMLSYLTAGADDPHRDTVLNDVIADAYHTLDLLTVKLKEKETPTLYYNIRRYEARQGAATSIVAGIERWKSARRQSTSMSSLFADASGRGDDSAKTTLESAELSLFNSVWTSFPLAKRDRDVIVDFVAGAPDDVTPSLAVRIVSALALALMEFADPQAVEALCDIYTARVEMDDDVSRNLAAVALTGLVIGLYKYSARVWTRTTTARISALTDLKAWHGDLRTVFMELVRSRDTERINRTMREEIIPGMLAMKPEIEKKIRDAGNPDDLVSADNPEWQDMLMNSDIGKRLKEFNDLQMEGADVFMSTFSHLKNFPFFNEAANWFTPYSRNDVRVEKVVDEYPELDAMTGLIEQMPFLCDSDKFSMLLSVNIVPRQQMQLMIDQLMANREQMEEFRSKISALSSNTERAVYIRNYIHNLYRFVNLFRRKGEFYNVFNSEINLLEVPQLEPTLRADVDLLRLVGEFYFVHKYYAESLTAFAALDAMGEFDATLYQKMGYAYEKTGRYADAARFYEQADLLDSGSRWLKLRMATVYGRLDRSRDALALLTRLGEDAPDDVDIALMTGYALIADDNYREALRHFHRAEFLAPENPRVLKALAWSHLMVREAERAANYYAKLLLHDPDPQDYLNMGHAALAQNRFKEAVNYYKTYMHGNSNNKETFFAALEADRAHMLRAGIAPRVVSLVADAVLYDIDTLNS